MGFMDKVKAQAEVALEKAQTGVAQGQAKVDQLTAQRAQSELMRKLGEAYYAHVKSGGSVDAVNAVLAEIDAAQAAHASAAVAAPPPPAAGTTAGDFTL